MKHRRLFETRRSGLPSQYGRSAMPRWDGGEDPRSGRTYKTVWPRMYRLCLDNGVTPDELVSTRFAFAGAQPPEPTDVMAPMNVEATRRRVTTAPADAIRKARGQLDRLKTMVLVQTRLSSSGMFGPLDPVTAVLFSPGVEDVPPVVRYAFAAGIGRADLAERLLPDAVADYSCRRARYASALDRLLTPQFFSLVARVTADAKRPPGTGETNE